MRRGAGGRDAVVDAPPLQDVRRASLHCYSCHPVHRRRSTRERGIRYLTYLSTKRAAEQSRGGSEDTGDNPLPERQPQTHKRAVLIFRCASRTYRPAIDTRGLHPHKDQPIETRIPALQGPVTNRFVGQFHDSSFSLRSHEYSRFSDMVVLACFATVICLNNDPIK